MFDASRKFNVEIKNVGEEPVVVEAVMHKCNPALRVTRVPPKDVLQPGQSVTFVGYEPGISHKITPGLRSDGHPLGILAPVPVEFGKPGVIEHAAPGLPPMPWTGLPEKEST